MYCIVLQCLVFYWGTALCTSLVRGLGLGYILSDSEVNLSHSFIYKLLLFTRIIHVLISCLALIPYFPGNKAGILFHDLE